MLDSTWIGEDFVGRVEVLRHFGERIINLIIDEALFEWRLLIESDGNGQRSLNSYHTINFVPLITFRPTKHMTKLYIATYSENKQMNGTFDLIDFWFRLLDFC